MIRLVKQQLKLIIFKKINFRNFLFSYYKKSTPFSFVQIGAHDGISHDFLYDFLQRVTPIGICIEPVQDYFEKLKSNFLQFKNVIFINKAIHNEAEKVSIFKVKKENEKDLPNWAPGCASFDKNHFQKLNIPENCIEEQLVAAQNINSIFSCNKLSHLDLLQMDTEGYDCKIVLNIDFKNIIIDIIKFEHVNCGLQELNEVKRMLEKYNYIIFEDRNDNIAIKRNIFIKHLFFQKAKKLKI